MPTIQIFNVSGFLFTIIMSSISEEAKEHADKILVEFIERFYVFAKEPIYNTSVFLNGLNDLEISGRGLANSKMKIQKILKDLWEYVELKKKVRKFNDSLNSIQTANY